MSRRRIASHPLRSIVSLLVLVIGLVAGLVLVERVQNLSEEASPVPPIAVEAIHYNPSGGDKKC